MFVVVMNFEYSPGGRGRWFLEAWGSLVLRVVGGHGTLRFVSLEGRLRCRWYLVCREIGGGVSGEFILL